MGLAGGLESGGQMFAIFDDGHHRQLPRLVKGPFKYRSYAYPLNGDVEGYPKEIFLDDPVNECVKDIHGCFEVGASVCLSIHGGPTRPKEGPAEPMDKEQIYSRHSFS